MVLFFSPLIPRIQYAKSSASKREKSLALVAPEGRGISHQQPPHLHQKKAMTS